MGPPAPEVVRPAPLTGLDPHSIRSGVIQDYLARRGESNLAQLRAILEEHIQTEKDGINEVAEGMLKQLEVEISQLQSAVK
jgi:hypothetical protein